MVDYNYLVNHITETTENDGTEFVNHIPKLVNLAEERLSKSLDDYGLMVSSDINLTAGVAVYTLVSTTQVIKNISFVENGTRINLLQRTDEFINDYWPVSTSTGTPKYYARTVASRIRIAPTPVSSYNAKIIFQERPPRLGTSATAKTENYFTERCYDALYAACMSEALGYMKNYTAKQVYEQQYQNAVGLLRNQSRRTRRDDMQTPASTGGGGNTIDGGL